MRCSALSCALAAAALFGISTPFAKLLIGAVDPWFLAGLFYLGSGVGLTLLRMALSAQRAKTEATSTRRDILCLGGAILSGGAVGPILLMVGLSQTEATTASLLLTLEGRATALISWFAFRENFDRRIATGMFLIATGAMALSWQGGARLQGLFGPAAIVGACFARGLDNKLTRRVLRAGPVQIALLKGLVAAPVSFALSFAHGAPLPTLATMAAAALVGFLGYGASLVSFVMALRVSVRRARTLVSRRCPSSAPPRSRCGEKRYRLSFRWRGLSWPRVCGCI
jgi:drug/metabolite transporter (DMT)-like permease